MIAYHTYEISSGTGPKWLCHCLENGKSRLVFFGATEPEATAKAKKWANSTLDTPERRELLRQRAEQRRITAEKNKAKELV